MQTNDAASELECTLIDIDSHFFILNSQFGIRNSFYSL